MTLKHLIMWVITFYGIKLILSKEGQNDSGKREHEDVTVIKLHIAKIPKVSFEHPDRNING